MERDLHAVPRAMGGAARRMGGRVLRAASPGVPDIRLAPTIYGGRVGR